MTGPLPIPPQRSDRALARAREAELRRVRLENVEDLRVGAAMNRERDREPFGSIPARGVVHAITTEPAPEPFDGTDIGGAA